MGLLATYAKFSTYVDANGYYRVIWQFSDGNIMMHKFDKVKTAKELDLFFADYEDWGGAVKLNTVLDDNEALIINAITRIRNNPSLTLAQYNTYLSGKQWYEAATIRTFIYKMGLKLAEHYGVVFTDYTESQVLLKVRNWICNADLRVLKRVFFGYNVTI